MPRTNTRKVNAYCLYNSASHQKFTNLHMIFLVSVSFHIFPLYHHIHYRKQKERNRLNRRTRLLFVNSSHHVCLHHTKVQTHSCHNVHNTDKNNLNLSLVFATLSSSSTIHVIFTHTHSNRSEPCTLPCINQPKLEFEDKK